MNTLNPTYFREDSRDFRGSETDEAICAERGEARTDARGVLWATLVALAVTALGVALAS